MPDVIAKLPREVLRLAEKVQTSARKLGASDQHDQVYRLILVFFMQRSVRLYGALLTLFDKGFGIEGSSLCRSLYEITLTLGFLEKDPKKHTRRMLDRSAIDLGKLAAALRKARKKGFTLEVYSPEQETEAFKAAKTVSKKYAGKDRNIWPEPAQLAREVGMELHDVFYGLFNVVAHPSPLTIGHFLKEEEQGFLVHEPDPRAASVDLHLVTGFLLGQMAKYNEMFQGDLGKDVDALLKRWAANEALING